MKFIKGKWYTGFNSDSDKIAFKFKSFDRNGNYIYFSEYIRKDRNHKYYDGYWKFKNNLRIMTQKELKKYLPKEHLDLNKSLYKIY